MVCLGRLRAAASLSLKSVDRGKEEWEVRQWAFSDRINMKRLHSQSVIDGLITAGMNFRRHNGMSGEHVSNLDDATLGDGVPAKDQKIAAVAFEVAVSVTGPVPSFMT